MPGDHADERGDDVGEFVGEVVGAPPLSDSEADAHYESGNNAVLCTLLAIEDDDEQERYEHGEKRCLVTDDGGNVRGRGCAVSRDAGDHVASRGDRRRDGAVGYRCGVGQKDGQRRLLGLDAQGQDHGGGDSNGSAEAGEGFEQAAEAEGDHHGLDADVAGTDLVEELAQVFRAPGDDGDLVEPHGHADDEHDGECAERSTLSCRDQSVAGRHLEADDCHQEGDDEGNHGGNVRFGLYAEQHDEERDERYACNEGREP